MTSFWILIRIPLTIICRIFDKQFTTMLINHKELTQRLGMQVRVDRPYPVKHRTFIEKLKALTEWLLMSYIKEPEKTIETMKKIKP